jgi:glycosyltransferase involved in cell wall biosynthesis
LKRKVLINGPFPPLFSYGGPTKSLKSLYDVLSDELNCTIVSPRKQLNSNSIVNIQDIQKDVIFTNNQTSFILKKFNEYNIIWLNSFFEFKTILIVYLNIFYKKKLIISPRGQLAEEAIKTSNYFFKNLFIRLLKPLQIHIIFHSTSIDEKNNIINFFPRSKTVIIPNISNQEYYENNSTSKKYLFYSRIHKKKGLDIILKYLDEYSIDIELDIYGFIEDKKYWSYCKKIINKMKNINYMGEISDGKFDKLRGKYMFFIFPTLNENFGHVIIELISEGIIPILSNGTTPFDDITTEFINLNFDLKSQADFKNSIQKSMSLNIEQISNLRKNLKQLFAKLKIQESIYKKDYVNFIKQI